MKQNKLFSIWLFKKQLMEYLTNENKFLKNCSTEKAIISDKGFNKIPGANQLAQNFSLLILEQDKGRQDHRNLFLISLGVVRCSCQGNLTLSPLSRQCHFEQHPTRPSSQPVSIKVRKHKLYNRFLVKVLHV